MADAPLGRKWPAWRVTFDVGDRVLDTNHPSWGVGVVIAVVGDEGGPQRQTVKFANGRRRDYYNAFSALQKQSS